MLVSEMLAIASNVNTSKQNEARKLLAQLERILGVAPARNARGIRLRELRATISQLRETIEKL
jgi:hypothetical protein